MLQAHFNMAKISIKVSFLCLLCAQSLSLGAKELIKQTQSTIITQQDTTKLKGSLTKGVESAAVNEINTDSPQKKITDLSQDTAIQKTPIAPVKKVPTLQSKSVSPNQPKALPNIKIPSKLQQPSVQLNNEPVQIKPAKKGGFNSALPAGTGTKALELDKPVTGVDGKSLLPPGTTGGPLHVLHDDHAPPLGLGGFAPEPGIRGDITHRPVTGSGETSLLPEAAPQIKLTIDYLVNARGSRIYLERSGHASSDTYILPSMPLTAQLTLQNLGGEPATVSVMPPGPGARPSSAISVSPGETKHVSIRTTPNESDSSSRLDTAKGPVFNALYYLVTATGSIENFSDANNSDNKVSVFIRMGSPPDVKIQTISGIHLKTNNMGYFNRGVNNNPDVVSEDVYVDVTLKNEGGFGSEPTRIDLHLKGQGDAIPENNHVHYIKSNGLGVTRTEHIDIPSIPTDGSYTAHVKISNVPFRLMDVDRQIRERTGPLTHHINHTHYYAGAGTFACGFPPFDDHNHHHNGWGGSHFMISAQLQGSGSQLQYQGIFKIGSFENSDCGVIPD